MNFDELISGIKSRKNLRILGTEYSEAAFGNFVIDVLFYDEMRMRLINDRGIIDLDILVPGWRREHKLPMKFAINSVLSQGNSNGPYEFESAEAAFEFLISNIGTLEEICKQRLPRKIWHEWRKNEYGRNMVR